MNVVTTLVTGATGFLGRHLVGLLAERGERGPRVRRVRAPRRARSRELGVEVVAGTSTDDAASARRPRPTAGSSIISPASSPTTVAYLRANARRQHRRDAPAARVGRARQRGSSTSRASPRSGPRLSRPSRRREAGVPGRRARSSLRRDEARGGARRTRGRAARSRRRGRQSRLPARPRRRPPRLDLARLGLPRRQAPLHDHGWTLVRRRSRRRARARHARRARYAPASGRCSQPRTAT